MCGKDGGAAGKGIDADSGSGIGGGGTPGNGINIGGEGRGMVSGTEALTGSGNASSNSQAVSGEDGGDIDMASLPRDSDLCDVDNCADDPAMRELFVDSSPISRSSSDSVRSIEYPVATPSVAS